MSEDRSEARINGSEDQRAGSHGAQAPFPTGAPDPSTADGQAHDERRTRIAQAAYYKAKAAGFPPGNEMAFWLQAEQEVDRAMGTGMDNIHVAESLPEG